MVLETVVGMNMLASPHARALGMPPRIHAPLSNASTNVRTTHRFQSAVGSLRAQVKAMEVSLDSERTARVQYESQFTKERLLTTELRGKVERAERMLDEAVRDKKLHAEQLEEAQRSLVRVTATLDDESSQRRALDRKIKLDAEGHGDHAEIAERARMAHAACESTLKERQADVTRLTEALRVSNEKLEETSKKLERYRDLALSTEQERATLIQTFFSWVTFRILISRVTSVRF